MSNDCIYLKKGIWKYSKIHSSITLDNLYQIDENDLELDNVISKIKVFKQPCFSSDIYRNEICQEHENWKIDLIKSQWYMKTETNNLTLEERKKEVDKTFGTIYDIKDKNLVIFKFTGDCIFSKKIVKDSNYSINNILWIKITKDYEAWMPYIDLK